MRDLSTGLFFLAVSLTLAGCGGGPVNSLTGSSRATAPAITTQPVNQTVNAGQTAMFSITATGTAPLTYQWRKGGASIIGATLASYTTAATGFSDNGTQFSVVVSNSVGSITSNPATLTVNSGATPPTITAQPVNQTVTAGQAATFSVSAVGSDPLTYQWKKSGTPISGATSASYTTPLTTTADNGTQFGVVF